MISHEIFGSWELGIRSWLIPLFIIYLRVSHAGGGIKGGGLLQLRITNGVQGSDKN